jgi:hypothetical protein
MSFLTIDLGEEPPNCRSCGSKPRLICKMLDPKSGETVRIFTCLCGDVSKTARRIPRRHLLGPDDALRIAGGNGIFAAGDRRPKRA